MDDSFETIGNKEYTNKLSDLYKELSRVPSTTMQYDAPLPCRQVVNHNKVGKTPEEEKLPISGDLVVWFDDFMSRWTSFKECNDNCNRDEVITMYNDFNYCNRDDIGDYKLCDDYKKKLASKFPDVKFLKEWLKKLNERLILQRMLQSLQKIVLLLLLL